ncbi:hypothetical protein ACFPRL_27440 [Pseudoclavibacter helvolus]
MSCGPRPRITQPPATSRTSSSHTKSTCSASGMQSVCQASCLHSPGDGPSTCLLCLAFASAMREPSDVMPSGVHANPTSSGEWIRALLPGMPA